MSVEDAFETPAPESKSDLLADCCYPDCFHCPYEDCVDDSLHPGELKENARRSGLSKLLLSESRMEQEYLKKREQQ